MCNAKSARKGEEELRDFAKYLDAPIESDWPSFTPRYRIGPKNRHLILHAAGEDSLAAEMAQWDLIPPPTKALAKPFLRTNARSDGLTTTWPWKMLLRSWRCITPVDGFYEPEKPALSKETVPWSYYSRKDDGLWWMAGLWNEIRDPETKAVLSTSYTIITTDANAAIRIHDRMPVFLDHAEARRWVLDPEPPLDLLRPYPAELMHGWRVADAAKSNRSPDGPNLIAPVADTPAPVQAMLL